MEQVERLSLPVMSYQKCWDLQRQRVSLCQQGGPGAVIFVEHRPVITLGRAGRQNSLTATDADLERAGIELVHSNRGGDITYHGPGQLVIYPILNLRQLAKGVHDYFRALEEVTLQTLSDFGVCGHRSSLGTGVWALHPQKGSCKIASMGIHIARWVTSHGVALNVCNSLDHFSYIVPCGLTGIEVTSMSEILGASIGRADVEDAFWSHLVTEFDLADFYGTSKATSGVAESQNSGR